MPHNNPFICLLTPSDLDKSQVRDWYSFCRQWVPSGLLSSAAVPHGEKGIEAARIIHTCDPGSGEHAYEVPLTRHLTDSEFKRLQEAFDQVAGENARVESSGVPIKNYRQLSVGGTQIEPEHAMNLSDTLAQYQHNSWCDERQGSGWRFGVDHDPQAKTTPLLRPWHELPERYRKIDKNLPTEIFNALEAMGFVIIPKDKLEKLLKKK